MPHPLVDQFIFTRSEWQRALEDVTEADASRHFGRMNSISWIVGHLAWHEQSYWLEHGLGQLLYPELKKLFRFGAPMSTPALSEMLEMWKEVTLAANPFLETLTTEKLETPLLRRGRDVGQSIGSALRRMTYHYWFHMGEILAIRQMLEDPGELPEFVGNIEQFAPYRRE